MIQYTHTSWAIVIYSVRRHSKCTWTQISYDNILYWIYLSTEKVAYLLCREEGYILQKLWPLPTVFTYIILAHNFSSCHNEIVTDPVVKAEQPKSFLALSSFQTSATSLSQLHTVSWKSHKLSSYFPRCIMRQLTDSRLFQLF